MTAKVSFDGAGVVIVAQLTGFFNALHYLQNDGAD